ncbi:hypothetical protein [Corallococcus exercitus]|uniref:Uncharacterized protein n=1 Tax=Corallococcus exercitus TaxID=2316736 RepID=A0A7Y4JNA7_9BACT|nr:hypothetical protein [Corallococcus exercitus]NOK07863.1 hypothetical protein [Corallococcus exercitus]
MRNTLLLLLLLSGCASPSRGTAAREAVADTDTDRIVRDLCDKQLALLGEESHHGNARTVAFKVALTRRLVGSPATPRTPAIWTRAGFGTSGPGWPVP